MAEHNDTNDGFIIAGWGDNLPGGEIRPPSSESLRIDAFWGRVRGSLFAAGTVMFSGAMVDGIVRHNNWETGVHGGFAAMLGIITVAQFVEAHDDSRKAHAQDFLANHVH